MSWGMDIIHFNPKLGEWPVCDHCRSKVVVPKIAQCPSCFLRICDVCLLVDRPARWHHKWYEHLDPFHSSVARDLDDTPGSNYVRHVHKPRVPAARVMDEIRLQLASQLKDNSFPFSAGQGMLRDWAVWNTVKGIIFAPHTDFPVGQGLGNAEVRQIGNLYRQTMTQRPQLYDFEIRLAVALLDVTQ